MVVRICRNPSLVEARLDGEKLLIKVPRSIRSRLLGKKIKVRKAGTDACPDLYEYVAP